ncbi:MAG: hypothetical protein K9G76_12600 [Bacteroidales bacterium]|nr:hypothetical protein [Bacteroidales bacterium]MCF8405407.1 hypothetical protein [Bacteroidales bacterium]
MIYKVKLGNGDWKNFIVPYLESLKIKMPACCKAGFVPPLNPSPDLQRRMSLGSDTFFALSGFIRVIQYFT